MASGRVMVSLFKRTLAVSVGVVLGMAIVAGILPLRHRLLKHDHRQPSSLPGEPAPGIRI